jgi:hypothetical protein
MLHRPITVIKSLSDHGHGEKGQHGREDTQGRRGGFPISEGTRGADPDRVATHIKYDLLTIILLGLY